MKTFRYSIQPGKAIHKLTVAETQRRVVDAMNDFERVCDVEFRLVRSEKDANLKFRFYSEVQLNGALGRLYDGDVVGLARGKSRNVNWDGHDGWLFQAVVCHESGHSRTLRHAMDGKLEYGHSAEKGSVMHGGLTAYWFTPTDVLGLQRKFGKPKRTFYPRPKAIVGRQVRALTIEWNDLSGARNAETNQVLRRKLDVKTKATFAKLKQAAKRWFELRDQWQSVPMAG